MQKSKSLKRFKRENEQRLASEKVLIDRRRNLLVLALEYLAEARLGQTFDALEREAGIACSKFSPADGVNLPHVLKEFEAYHEIKFNKKASYFVERKGKPGSAARGRGRGKSGSRGKSGGKSVSSTTQGPQSNNNGTNETSQQDQKMERKSIRELRAEAKKTPVFRQPNRKKNETRAQDQGGDDSAVDGNGLSVGNSNTSTSTNTAGNSVTKSSSSADDAARERRQRRMSYNPSQMPPGLGVPLALKGRSSGTISGPAGAALLPAAKGTSTNSTRAALVAKLPYAMDSESHQLAMAISRDIHVSVAGTTFDDVVGLHGAKQLLQEAVVYPVKYPELFTGLLSPWKGILLYGPPGTGKTMLAKAVAAECKTTFFNISASSIVSKFRGDSEKLVRVLFELARLHAPSTIFMDEIDAILGQRGSREHEASRRLKTELLIQMDGLNKTDDLVFLLAASNLPWSLDFALLRRLEKRVYVGLPDTSARRVIVEKLIPPGMCAGVDYDDVAAKTERFSGSDMHLLCKESAMGPLRRLMHKLDLTTLDTNDEDAEVQLGEITTEDIAKALESTRPSSNVEESRYAEWAAKHGSE